MSTDLAAEMREKAAGIATAGPTYYHLIRDDEIERLPKPEYEIEGIVTAGGLAVLFGPPGSGKTFVALDWALSMGTGRPWLGRHVRAGLAVYIAAEGSAGLGARIRAWKAHRQHVGPAGVYFLPQTVNLLEPADVARLIASIGGLPDPPTAVLIDTLARSIPGGDENSAQDMGLAIGGAERIRQAVGCLVVLVHHTNAGGERERGSTALRGAVDVMVAIRPQEDGSFKLECEKMKDDVPFQTLRLALLPMAESCVVVTAEERSAVTGAAPTVHERQVLESLQAAAPPEGLTATTWAKVSGVKERTFYIALKGALAKGYVEKDKDGRGARYHLTRPGAYLLTANCTVTATSLQRSEADHCMHTQGPLGPAGCSDSVQEHLKWEAEAERIRERDVA